MNIHLPSYIMHPLKQTNKQAWPIIKILNHFLFLISSLSHGQSPVGVMVESCLFFVGNFFFYNAMLQMISKKRMKILRMKEKLAEKIVLLLTSICVLLLYKLLCVINTHHPLWRELQTRTGLNSHCKYLQWNYRLYFCIFPTLFQL